jgi:phosphorylase kinase alpha/beta subunit
MIIDGVFKSLPEQVEEYQNLLKARVYKDLNGGKQHIAFNLIL